MPQTELDFDQRVDLPELMDGPCSYEDFRDCLRDIQQFNTLGFSRRATLRWLRGVLRGLHGSGPVHIVDVGCGGGDTLRHIEQAAKRWRVPVKLTGIDLNPCAARAAREFTPPGSAIEWVTGDAFSYKPAVAVDVVMSSLFTHHLPDAEIVHFLQWMSGTARVGWLVNDLHRQAGPYHLFRAMARLMRWHRFVQHDGPLSVRRSFRPADWLGYLRAAKLESIGAVVQPAWPARVCVSWQRPG